MKTIRKLSRATARLPIRWRLALVTFGLLTLLLAALGTLISITEEDALLSTQAGALSNQANAVLSSLKLTSDKQTTSLASSTQGVVVNRDLSIDESISGTDSTILSAVVIIMTNPSVRASVISREGRFLVNENETFKGEAQPEVVLDRGRVEHNLDQPYLLANDSHGRRDLVVLMPLAKIANSAFILELNMSTAPIDQYVETMRLILFLGIVVALGIAALLMLPLVSVVLRPVVEMERTSQRIAEGALSLRLREPPMRDEVGRLARSFNSMVARLEASFARQKRFVGDVSHELRTPLTALGGSLEMLLLGADDGDAEVSRRLMRGMYAEVERMQRLVADLLVLSRLDEGQIKLREESIDIGLLVREVSEQAQQLARGQEITCDIAPSLPVMCGDGDQLRRVLLNVTENALKFTPPTGCVDLSVRSESVQVLVVEISDTGIGIPAEELPHIFDRFYRVDTSRARSSSWKGGSGLGLSIAQSLVEAHHGTICVSSTPGCGTRVTIRLPVGLPGST